MSLRPMGGVSGAFMVGSSGARSRRSSSGNSTSSSSTSSSGRPSEGKPQKVRLLSKLPLERLLAPWVQHRVNASGCAQLAPNTELGVKVNRIG